MDNIDMIFIGDSLTFGYGLSKKDGFVYKIQNYYKEKVILNKGVNGDTSSGILSRYYRDVTSKKPKITFLMCGTNDLLSGRSINYIMDNIELMVLDLLNIKSKIILGIPPMILKSEAERLFSYSSYYEHATLNLPLLRERILSLKEKCPLEIVDVFLLSKNNLSKGIFTDGIHLNTLGNSLIFDELLNVIKGF